MTLTKGRGKKKVFYTIHVNDANGKEIACIGRWSGSVWDFLQAFSTIEPAGLFVHLDHSEWMPLTAIQSVWRGSADDN